MHAREGRSRLEMWKRINVSIRNLSHVNLYLHMEIGINIEISDWGTMQ